MASTTPIQNRPTSHTNHGNQKQPVNVSNQQFTSGGQTPSSSSTAETEEPPKKPERKDFPNSIEYLKAIKQWHENYKSYEDKISFVDKNKEINLLDEQTLDSIFSEFSDKEHEFYKGDPEKAMQHLIDLITPDSVKELLDNGIGEGMRYMAADPSIKGYQVPTVPAIFQRLIFGNSKGHSMSKQEFDSMQKKDFTGDITNLYDDFIDVENVSSAGKVVVYRGLNSITTDQLARVKEGFYSNGSKYSKTLIGSGGCYGCVIYMSANKEYSMEDYASSDLIVGVVNTDPSKVRIHNFINEDADEVKDYVYLMQHSRDYIPKIEEKLSSLGVDSLKASNIAASITNYLSDDGFASMILGYDLVIGDSNQLDVVNPNVLTVVRE